MIDELKRIYKIMRVRLKNRSVYFGKKANITARSQFEGENKIGTRALFDGYMGRGSYIGDDCVIHAKIGRYCSIGHKVTVQTGTHPSRVFVSTSPTFYSLARQNGTTYVTSQKFNEHLYADEKNKYGAIIGNDVWIGYNATIMGGCKIGDGAIIASGALIRKDVNPYTIVAGQPAKEIGKRFTDEQIEQLLKIQWWDRPEEWIIEHSDDFDNIEKFILNTNV